MTLRIPERSRTIEEWQRKVRDAVNALIAEKAGRLESVTVDYAVEDDVSELINNKAGSSQSLTLPDATKYTRRTIGIKNLQTQTIVSASSNVAPIGSVTPGTAILPATVGAWCVLKSNGAHWVVMRRGT